MEMRRNVWKGAENAGIIAKLIEGEVEEEAARSLHSPRCLQLLQGVRHHLIAHSALQQPLWPLDLLSQNPGEPPRKVLRSGVARVQDYDRAMERRWGAEDVWMVMQSWCGSRVMPAA
jgi:hypothetical protein